MGIFDDIRFAFRSFYRKPGFPAAALFTLALTMGVNASMFSLIKAILLEPLSMKRPSEVVAMDALRPDGTRYPFTIPYWTELRNRAPLLSEMAALGGMNANLADEAAPERVLGVRATGNYFQMLGIEAQAGRLLAPDDDRPGSPKVIVIGDGLWRRRFGAGSAAIGKTVRLNGEPYTLIGVLPATFQFKNPGQEFAVPLYADADPFRGVWNSTAFLRIYGRLRPRVTLAQAKASLDDSAAAIRREHPKETATIAGIDVLPLQQDLTGESRMLLTILMGAVLLLLLIACANISSLALARSAGRLKEFALRLALGATRGAIARQVLIENLILFTLAGVAGLGLAHWGVIVLVAGIPDQLPRLHEVRLDGVVAAAVLGAAWICGLVFGAIPAIRTHSTGLSGSLKPDGRGHTGARDTSLMRGSLVVGEAALSLILLSGTGLLLQSFSRVMAVAPGFQSEGLTTFRLALPSTRYKTPDDIVLFHDKLLDRLQQISGVESAGAISILPFSGPIASSDFTIPGAPPFAEKEKPTAQYRMADTGYFRTMRIPILHGRGFSTGDSASAPPVVVISQSLAARYWKDKDPIGRAIRIEDNPAGPRLAEVVGIAGDTRESSLEERPVPCLYVAMPQVQKHLVRFLTNNMFWAVRVHGPADVTPAARRVIGNMDGDIAVASSSMNQYLSRATAKRRFLVRMLSTFALAALLLAAGGLYALLSFSITQRTWEFGVRIALGATGREVARMVLWQGVSLAIAGTLCGGMLTVVVSRYAASMLFEVKPADPVAIGGAVFLLLSVAAAACIVPMRRAMRSDPIQCLRAE